MPEAVDMSFRPTVVCVGEILWDVLPHGRFIGGAPFNVAAHLARLGLDAQLVSRVGDDRPGEAALAAALGHGIDVANLQVDTSLPTGEARAEMAIDGSASFRFNTPAAWDALDASQAALSAASRSDALVFGTLAQRLPSGAAAVRALAQAARWRVFDMNLREPWVQRETVLESLRCADLVKLNEEECARCAVWLGCDERPERLQPVLRREFGIESLCVTRGPRAALWYHEGRWHEQPVLATTVVDTVGAGDSFLAMLLATTLRGLPPPRALLRAARLASLVAGSAGAVPDYDPREFDD